MKPTLPCQMGKALPVLRSQSQKSGWLKHWEMKLHLEQWRIDLIEFERNVAQTALPSKPGYK